MNRFSLEIPPKPELADAFSAISRAFEKFECPYYLIGAQTREIWFSPKISPRYTRDIDFVAATDDEQVFKNICDHLVEKERFVKRSDSKLVSPESVEVDLIPFFEPIEGLRQVFEKKAISEFFWEGFAGVAVANPAAVVLLKLIAWAAVPEYRVKDLIDILSIMEQFFDRFDVEIYKNHLDLFEENRSLEAISANVIGREIGQIVTGSEPLKNRLIEILSKNKEEIAERMALPGGKNKAQAAELLDFLLMGILEKC